MPRAGRGLCSRRFLASHHMKDEDPLGPVKGLISSVIIGTLMWAAAFFLAVLVMDRIGW
jgi:hypothetical protein